MRKNRSMKKEIYIYIYYIYMSNSATRNSSSSWWAVAHSRKEGRMVNEMCAKRLFYSKGVSPPTLWL